MFLIESMAFNRLIKTGRLDNSLRVGNEIPVPPVPTQDRPVGLNYKTVGVQIDCIGFQMDCALDEIDERRIADAYRATPQTTEEARYDSSEWSAAGRLPKPRGRRR